MSLQGLSYNCLASDILMSVPSRSNKVLSMDAGNITVHGYDQGLVKSRLLILSTDQSVVSFSDVKLYNGKALKIDTLAVHTVFN